MKKQEFLGFAILHFAIWGKRAKQAVQIFSFFFCFSKIYGSQSQIQKKSTLYNRLYEKQLGMKVKIHNSSALLAGNWPSSLYKK